MAVRGDRLLAARGMIGLIVPSNNKVVLPEFYSALPQGVTAYETRMRVEGELHLGGPAQDD